MTRVLQSAVVVGAAGGVALAAWLVPASVHIVAWPTGGPERMALFGPLVRLVWLSAAALAVAAIILAAARSGPRRLSRVAGLAAPLLLLWLWAVPYAPWLPDRLPLLLVLAGPMRWVVVAVAALGMLSATGWLRAPGRQWAGAGGRRTAFGVSLVLFVLFGVMHVRTIGPGGDEPHYLIIVDSLLLDGDLQIENNHRRGDYRAYFRGGELRPDYLARGTNGAIYSVHAAGLPVILLPAYGVAGYPGAVLMLALIGALTALAIFDLGLLLGGRPIGWLTWAATCLTAPFMPYAWLIFPEMPGALLVAWATLWSLRPVPSSARVWAWRGLALAILPWLHTKFVVLLAVFGLAASLRLWKSPKLAVAFSTPIAMSGIAWLASFYVVYGTIDPQAPYGAWAATNVFNANIPRGLLGLTFDQKFGLLFYSPIYIAAPVGCWLMLRRPDLRIPGAILLLVAAVHFGSTTRLYMWWGGSSAPARFLVPILPCLAAMVAVALREARSAVSRGVLGVWLTISVAVALVGVVWPERLFLFSEPHGRGRLVETLQAGSPLAFVIPTFTTQDWRTPLQALGPWLLAAAASLALTYGVARTAAARSPLWFGTFASGMLLLSAALVAARPRAEAREDAARRGALDVLWRYDASLRGFSYSGLSRLTHAEMLERAVVVDRRTPAGPYALPPGDYEARVWFAGGAARTGTVAVSSSRAAVFGRRSGALDNPTVVPFDIPVAASRVTVAPEGDALIAAAVQIELVPRSIIPRSERPIARARAIESVAGQPGQYIVYLDQHAYPEGGVFWTRATEASTVLVAPGGRTRLTLTLHLGPRAGDVIIEAAGRESRVAVGANDTAQFTMQVPEGLRLVPITIQSPTTFVPADVAQTDDTRQLGCQVRVELQ